MKSRFLAGTTLVLSSLLTAAAHAEVTGPIMLEIDGERPSEILSWSWGASQSGSFHVGGGGGAGKANFQDISITRVSDAQSVSFLSAVAEGRSIESAEITRENMTITLQQVLVTSYSVGGSVGNTKAARKGDPQTENLTLNFARVLTEIDGAAFCFDVQANTPC